jgi:hypothetical protein
MLVFEFLTLRTATHGLHVEYWFSSFVTLGIKGVIRKSKSFDSGDEVEKR